MPGQEGCRLSNDFARPATAPVEHPIRGPICGKRPRCMKGAAPFMHVSSRKAGEDAKLVEHVNVGQYKG